MPFPTCAKTQILHDNVVVRHFASTDRTNAT